MTPLLWIQYSKTMYDFLRAFQVGSEDQANVIRLQTLELGLLEFPASSLLQIYYNYWLMKSSEPFEKKDEALKMAIEAVGTGSHRNEGAWVAILYRFQVELYTQAAELTSEEKVKQISESYIRRSGIPMKDVNDTIASEYRECCRQNGFEPDKKVEELIERGRRMEARNYSSFASVEDEIDVAMHEEGILGRFFLTQPMNGVMPEEWIDELESSSDQKFAMGLGGEPTANAFLSYIKMLRVRQSTRQKRKYSDPDEDESNQDESLSDRISHLISQVYERAVAECPTVEKLWISYFYHISNKAGAAAREEKNALLSRLHSVIQRACRNCPYSYTLVKKQLQLFQLVAAADESVLDPDQLLGTVQNALNKGFLPPSPTIFLGLYLETIRIVKQRILHLLTKKTKSKKVGYDDSEELTKNQALDTELDDNSKEEAVDLIDELADMFDEIESRLKESHPSWSDGRALLWREKAASELLLIQPCNLAFSEKSSSSGIPYATREMMKSVLNQFEKCCKVHNPPHPDVYLSYVRQFTSCGSLLISGPIAVGRHIRNIRFLYQKAVHSVGPQHSNESVSQFGVRNYARALSDLCQEWIDFEQMFGSERSLSLAEKAVSTKMKRVTTDAINEPAFSQDADSNGISREKNKRKTFAQLEHDESYEASPKKVKKEDPNEKDDNVAPMQSEAHGTDPKDAIPVENEVDAKPNVKKPDHKVHPFTIRVSNLDPSTEDMDLVDVFRPLCGAIVHAKIIRDKHDHGVKAPSKGWGLVQFEEKDSVQRALALNEEIGIKEKLVKIEMSHMPAVYLVPPGMHRVNLKGQGKKSKINQKRREKTKASDNVDDDHKKPEKSNPDREDESLSTNSKAKIEGASVLAFKPRGVTRRPKVTVPKGK